jgi:hypothetical protein
VSSSHVVDAPLCLSRRLQIAIDNGDVDAMPPFGVDLTFSARLSPTGNADVKIQIATGAYRLFHGLSNRILAAVSAKMGMRTLQSDDKLVPA